MQTDIIATMSPDDYINLVGDWPLLVGRFILSFSSCEHWTYLILQQFGTDQTFATDSKLTLRKRTQKILAYVAKLGLPDDLFALTRGRLKELRDLGNKRNLAAHNAPMAHVFADESGELRVDFQTRAALNQNIVLTKKDLESWFLDAVELDNHLCHLHAMISNRIVSMKLAANTP